MAPMSIKGTDYEPTRQDFENVARGAQMLDRMIAKRAAEPGKAAP